MLDGSRHKPVEWAYTPEQMTDLHRRTQEGRGSLPIVDESNTLEGANQTENEFKAQRLESLRQQLTQEITNQKILQRVESILESVLSARNMSVDNLTSKDIQLITQQITDLYHKKFPDGFAQEQEGIQTLSEVSLGGSEYNQTAATTYEFYTQAQAIIRDTIDRHDIDQELKKVEKYRQITDTIITKDLQKEIYQDEKTGQERLLATMDAFVAGEKFEQYLRAVAEATAELDALFAFKTEKQGVWDRTRQRLESIFSTVVSLWNTATAVTMREFVERSNYGKEDPRFMEAKTRLSTYIEAGEKLARAHDNSHSRLSMLTGLNTERLEEAKSWMSKLG